MRERRSWGCSLRERGVDLGYQPREREGVQLLGKCVAHLAGDELRLDGRRYGSKADLLGGEPGFAKLLLLVSAM